MSKNSLLMMAALMAGLCCAGCNKAGKLSEPSTKPAPTGPVELKLKWPTGQRMVQSMEVKLNMEFTAPNQPAPTKQDMTMGEEYALDVLKAEPDGGHEVELEFLNVRMKLDQGGSTLIDYDSAKKTADRQRPGFAAVEKMFQNIIGAKLQYHLDASNQVAKIDGVDALKSRMAAGGRGPAAAGFQSMFSEDTLKQMISGQHLPPNPVQPGDSWPVHLDMAMAGFGTLSTDYSFTLANWEKRGVRNCARMEFQGTITSKNDAKPLPGGVSMTIQDGNSSGVSWFDPELGLVIETLLNQDINMTMSIPMRAQGKTTTQTVTSSMKEAITVKFESVK